MGLVKYIMGLIGKVHPSKEVIVPQPSVSLTLSEVDVLMRALMTANSPVKDIEQLYNTIYKLQEYRKLLTHET